uniref:Uncharacterized protein n=1 Tax=Trichogramma kaykai TaxID=54128 RepID=A0ABD2WHL0_9HYME
MFKSVGKHEEFYTRGRIRRCARESSKRRSALLDRRCRSQINPLLAQCTRANLCLGSDGSRRHPRDDETSSRDWATIACLYGNTFGVINVFPKSSNTPVDEPCWTVDAWDRHATSSACVNNRQQESLRRLA